MKKCFLFASLIAMVAVLATSCKPKEEDPRALFSYSDDGLEVTFENLSKNAVSFVWEFGDGKTSTEKNPVHVYEKYGDYTVTLTAKNGTGAKHVYEDEINLVKRSIVIDGKFSDWEALGNKAAICKHDEDDVYDGWLGEAKFVRDDDFIYFYLDLSDVVDDINSNSAGVVREHYNEHVQFMLNFGDDAICCNLWYFATPILGFIEATWTDRFESAGLYLTDPVNYGKDVEEWAWLEPGTVNFMTSCEAVEIGPETNEYILEEFPNAKRLGLEGKIDIMKIGKPIVNNTVKIGVAVLSSEGDWVETGALPEKTAEGVAPMIEVPVAE